MATDAIRKTVLVDFAPAEAFELFTARIGSWWPVGTHSYGGEDVTDVVLEQRVGGRLYEVTEAGEQDWGSVLEWDPPSRFVLDWQIGEARGTEVEVRFSPEGRGRARRARAPRLRLRHPARALRGGLGHRPRCLRRAGGLAPSETRNARNQRSRSSHGTAAFAGEVEGSTNRAVAPEPPLLRPELRPLAERAPVGLLADEADRLRAELEREPLQPLGGAREVGAPEVAGAGRRPRALRS